jgi:hypothetical protein
MGRILSRPSCTGPARAACTAHTTHYGFGAAARAHGRLVAQHARRPERIAKRSHGHDGAASWGKSDAGPANGAGGDGSAAWVRGAV